MFALIIIITKLILLYFNSLFSVDVTANELLHRVFPDDESKKEALNLPPERYCL